MYSADEIIKIIEALSKASYVKYAINKLFTPTNIKAAFAGAVEGGIRAKAESR